MTTADGGLALAVAERQEQLVVQPERLVVAGYTARDEGAVRAHIDELAEIGVPPPPTVPMFYHLGTELLTTEGAVDVTGSLTSGEVEPVLVRHAGHWYLGIGSDHTDRDLERRDVGTSKASCPKPMGGTVVRLPDGVAHGAFDADWDVGHAACLVDGAPYQAGRLQQLRPPSDLIARLAEQLPEEAADGWPDDLVVFAGTLPLIEGEFRPGRAWQLTLTLPFPDGPTTLSHAYDVTRRSR